MTAPDVRLADHVVVVLVQPQHPGNVGTAARGMANFGLRQLVVVDPPPSFDPETVRWMAPGADVVLDRLRIVRTLDDALEGVHHVVGTTARHRGDGQKVQAPDGFAEGVFAAPAGHTTALLFGREDTGLPREATVRCASLVRIPTDAHASLNLGMAVVVCAHQLFEAARREGLAAPGRILARETGARSTRALEKRGRSPLADVPTLEPAIDEVMTLVGRVGWLKTRSDAKTASLLRAGMQQARLTERQVHAIRGAVRRLRYALDHPEIDWSLTRKQRRAQDHEE